MISWVYVVGTDFILKALKMYVHCSLFTHLFMCIVSTYGPGGLEKWRKKLHYFPYTYCRYSIDAENVST